MERVLLERDARRTERRFGEAAISLFSSSDATTLDELGRSVLSRFETLTLMPLGVIWSVGLEVRPTFRRPHYSVMLPSLGDLDRLLTCQTLERPNPHHLLP